MVRRANREITTVPTFIWAQRITIRTATGIRTTITSLMPAKLKRLKSLVRHTTTTMTLFTSRVIWRSREAVHPSSSLAVRLQPSRGWRAQRPQWRVTRLRFMPRPAHHLLTAFRSILRRSLCAFDPTTAA